MKTALFFIFICIAFLINLSCGLCQEVEKFQYGFYFSPEYQNRKLTKREDQIPNDGRNYNLAINRINNGIKDRDTTESYKIGFSAGITATYSPMKFLSFRTGLIFSNKGFSHKKMPTCRPNPMDCKIAFFGNLPGAKMMAGTRNYGYIGIPFFLHLKANFHGQSLGLFGGPILNYHLYNLRYYKEFGPNDEKLTYFYNPTYEDYFYKFINELVIGISFERKLFQGYTLSIEPTFKYSGPLYKPTGIETNLYSIGVGLDFKRNFKNKK